MLWIYNLALKGDSLLLGRDVSAGCAEPRAVAADEEEAGPRRVTVFLGCGFGGEVGVAYIAVDMLAALVRVRGRRHEFIGAGFADDVPAGRCDCAVCQRAGGARGQSGEGGDKRIALMELLRPFLHAGHIRCASPCLVRSSSSSVKCTVVRDLSE